MSTELCFAQVRCYLNIALKIVSKNEPEYRKLSSRKGCLILYWGIMCRDCQITPRRQQLQMWGGSHTERSKRWTVLFPRYSRIDKQWLLSEGRSLTARVVVINVKARRRTEVSCNFTLLYIQGFIYLLKLKMYILKYMHYMYVSQISIKIIKTKTSYMCVRVTRLSVLLSNIWSWTQSLLKFKLIYL